MCLGFTAFEKLQSNDNFKQITQTIYSNSIAIKHDLSLDYTVPPYGNLTRGSEVALFLNTNKAYKKANVRLFMVDSKIDQRLDIVDVEILPKNEKRSRNIFVNNKTIVFTIPPLSEELKDTIRKIGAVFIEVYIPSTKEVSNPSIFGIYNERTAIQDETDTIAKPIYGNSIRIYDAAKPLVKVVIETQTQDWIIINDKYANAFQGNFGDFFKACVHIVPQFPECSCLRVEVDNGFKEDIALNVVIVSQAMESRFREKNATIAQPMLTHTAKPLLDDSKQVMTKSNENRKSGK